MALPDAGSRQQNGSHPLLALVLPPLVAFRLQLPGDSQDSLGVGSWALVLGTWALEVDRPLQFKRMLRIVSVLLIAWEPLRFAGEALRVLPSIGYRGALAGVELLVHGLVAALSATAGFALWNETPDARRIATIAVIALMGRAVQSVYWSVLPNSTKPGDEAWTAGVAVLIGMVLLAAIRKHPDAR